MIQAFHLVNSTDRKATNTCITYSVGVSRHTEWKWYRRRTVCFAYQHVCNAFGWLFVQIIKRKMTKKNSGKHKQWKVYLTKRVYHLTIDLPCVYACIYELCGWTKNHINGHLWLKCFFLYHQIVCKMLLMV